MYLLKIISKQMLMLVIPIFFIGCAQTHTDHGHSARHSETDILKPHRSDSLFKVTDNKRYSVELRMKGNNLSVGNNRAEIVIHRVQNGEAVDVENAYLDITPWMPLHKHGVSTKAVITDKGAGVYAASDIEASMEGLWELKINIRAINGEDNVIFAFPDVRKTEAMGHSENHAGKMDRNSGMNAPEGTDFSTQKMSLRNLFKFSYEIMDRKKIPVNQIHSWKLIVNTNEGRPVTHAQIQVDGDMPAHGHGMPTKPMVTKEINPGIYLVEGMKFSMPGHWVIKFFIRTETETDAVSFDIVLN